MSKNFEPLDMERDLPEEANADLMSAFNRIRDRQSSGINDGALIAYTIYDCATAVCWGLAAALRELRHLRGGNLEVGDGTFERTVSEIQRDEKSNRES